MMLGGTFDEPKLVRRNAVGRVVSGHSGGNRAAPRTHLGRQMHEKSKAWGAGYLTYMEKASAWQATCPRCRSHVAKDRPATKCKKRVTFHSDDECLEVERRLKHWLNVCMSFPTRTEHMKYQAPSADVPADDELEREKTSDNYASGSDQDIAVDAPARKRRRAVRGGLGRGGQGRGGSSSSMAAAPASVAAEAGDPSSSNNSSSSDDDSADGSDSSSSDSA